MKTKGSRQWRTRAMMGIAPLLAVFFLACSDSVAPENGGDGVVQFSHPAGFYGSAFGLSLSTTLEDATLYYTIDGSLPDPEHVMDDEQWDNLPVETRARTFVYEGPIDLGAATDRPNEIVNIPTNDIPSGEGAWIRPPEPVQKAVPVRVAAFTGSGETAGASLSAETATRTYFIVSGGRARYSFPVVSLSLDRASLFSADSGIYVPGATGGNYHERGEEWERRAHFELFDRAGQRPLAQDIGVRIHGGWTRNIAQKTLRLYSRSDYGTSRFSYRFFDSKEIDDFNRILLRNSGNDWGRTMFRDAAMQTLVQHFPIASQHYQPAILFINGEYWGIHNIRDRLDNHYVETHYGVDRDEIVILEGNAWVSDGEPGDEVPYREFVARASGGDFQSFAEFDEHMDLSGYLDYVAVQWYAANHDWPHNNVDFWRYKGTNPSPDPGPRDGRWRWLLYDVDFAFGIYHTNASTNMVQHMYTHDQPWATELFRALMEVAEIRHEFLQRSAVHLSTTFEPDRVQSHLSAMAQVVEPEMPEHVARWGKPESMGEWNRYVSEMMEFAGARPANVRSHIVGHYGDVLGTAPVDIMNVPSGGSVALHSVVLSQETPGVSINGGQWSGELFTGIPVVLTSSGTDLSGTTASGGAEVLEASADRVRFILTGPAQVSLSN